MQAVVWLNQAAIPCKRVAMSDLVPRLRIFLSSPSDVVAERQIALEVIDVSEQFWTVLKA